MKEDFEFVQGKQWEDKDVETLRKQGVKALVINKIKPIIKLITGIERQSKSDFVGFPEGGEDSLVSNIITLLLKNVSKMGDLQTKQSIQFKNGGTGGLAYIEPYIDYSSDLINGILKFKTVSGMDVFPDPDGLEYDMSDHKFNIKIQKDLSKEDLELLFPDDTAKINKIVNGKVDMNAIQDVDQHIQGLDYPDLGDKQSETDAPREDTYDLIDYQYKTLKTAYYVADKKRGVIKEAESKEQAEEIAGQIEGAVVISKKIPEIRHYQVVGNQVFFDDVLWTYPRWKGYSRIPFYAEFNTENVNDKELSIQGVVRVIKDLQTEFNKRRTQELRHLNASANSGFQIEDGQLDSDNLAKVKEFGSSPGVIIMRKKGTPVLERITPMPLSQGHAQLAEENTQDLKEASGVNPDLLATDSNSQSGRAILLKQRQGLVMIQEMLDNFATTKKLTGRFILSQLKELYTVETAMRVIGDEFVQEAFTVPVTAIIQRGLDKMVENKDDEVSELEKSWLLKYPNNSAESPVVDENGQLVPAVDFDEAFKLINQILNDSEIGKYDVSVGEGPFNETVRISNFSALTDLAQQGVPIPPTTLIEMSLIPENEKKKILGQIEAQQASQAQVQAQASQLEQAKIQVDAEKNKEDIRIDDAEIKIKEFLAQLEAFKARAELQLESVKIKLDSEKPKTPSSK